MVKQFPQNPNLENFKKQAKSLLKAHKQGDLGALSRIKSHLSRFSQRAELDIVSARFSLRDAQRVIAGEFGFTSWQRLADKISSSAVAVSAKAQLGQVNSPAVGLSPIVKLDRRAEEAHSLLCVGLDSAIERLPEDFKKKPNPQFAFNRWIIEQTHAFVCAYKPNIAFYEARGDEGLRDLKLTLDYLHSRHPDILTICDAKRGDNSNSNTGYVTAIFDWFGFDAITLQPYMGSSELEPFLERADKGCIVLCRTSNQGAHELQGLSIDGKPLWQFVAESARDRWNVNGNCMLVVGATVPKELGEVRALVGEMPLLVPGIGAQGGKVEQVVRAGLNADGKGLIINASRSVIFAEDPAVAARDLRDEINLYR